MENIVCMEIVSLKNICLATYFHLFYEFFYNRALMMRMLKSFAVKWKKIIIAY